MAREGPEAPPLEAEAQRAALPMTQTLGRGEIRLPHCHGRPFGPWVVMCPPLFFVMPKKSKA